MTGSGDPAVKIVDLRKGSNGSPLQTFKQHTKTVTSLQCESQGRLLSGGRDNRVKAFDLKTNCYLYEIFMFGKVRCLQFDEQKLFVGSESQRVYVYNFSNGILPPTESSINQSRNYYQSRMEFKK